MTANQARKVTNEIRLSSVKEGIERAIRQGRTMCIMEHYYLTPEVEAYLKEGGYNYQKRINRGGWFATEELVIDWR